MSQVIGCYQIICEIAVGGQAKVYQARHTVLQREVALKVLHPHLITAPDFVAKFAREAQLLAQLKHPNIVEVYDANCDAASGLYYIAMEFLSGSDLETLIAQQGRLAVDVALSVAKQVASALEYAHARNLIHRDIKPANIILLPDGSVKVLDFGIAAIVAAGQRARTRIGTQEYMAPEHFAGNADARSDIYSLGATLYHCLTGQLPPVIAVQPPTPPCQLNPAINVALQEAILKSLQSDSAKRQQTAREFIIETESAMRAPHMSVSALATIQCLHCGAANRVGAKHCATCGRAVTVVPKAYGGPLNVRMANDPLSTTQDNEPRFYWSPDGTRLLIVESFSGTVLAQILGRRAINASFTGKKPTVIVTPIEDVSANSRPDWSLDGKEILYTSAKDGKIRVFDIKSRSYKQLTVGEGVHSEPRRSPDGSCLAFMNEQATVRRWQILDLNNWGLTTIDNDICAGWAPAGKRFACLDHFGNTFALFENAAGNISTVSKAKLPSGLQFVSAATWLTDTQIVVQTSQTIRMFVTLVDLQKADAQSICGKPHVQTSGVLIAEKTRWIACVEHDDWKSGSFGESSILWIDASDLLPHKIASTAQADCLQEVCGWSPDASRILFTRLMIPNFKREIYVVNINDTGLQHLTDGYAPKWSPDGKYIAFLRSPQEKWYELWVMEIQ